MGVNLSLKSKEKTRLEAVLMWIWRRTIKKSWKYRKITFEVFGGNVSHKSNGNEEYETSISWVYGMGMGIYGYNIVDLF